MSGSKDVVLDMGLVANPIPSTSSKTYHRNSMDHRRHILCNLESALLRQQVPDQLEPILNKESFVQLFSNVVNHFVNTYSRAFHLFSRLTALQTSCRKFLIYVFNYWITSLKENWFKSTLSIYLKKNFGDLILNVFYDFQRFKLIFSLLSSVLKRSIITFKTLHLSICGIH